MLTSYLSQKNQKQQQKQKQTIHLSPQKKQNKTKTLKHKKQNKDRETKAQKQNQYEIYPSFYYNEILRLTLLRLNLLSPYYV